MLKFRMGVAFLGACLVFLAAFFFWKTSKDLRPLPPNLALQDAAVARLQFLDRSGNPLTTTYLNDWNFHNQRPLYAIPRLLQRAFIEAEDKRFYQHSGVDWRARFHAALQNIAALRVVRGASTISEQVVRMLHPRPRTLWSRWLETIEAGRLEQNFSKAQILEFYLNQVPYSGRRRGVVQAARLYFNCGLDALRTEELLALAVLVRAPGTLDLRRSQNLAKRPVERLAARMFQKKLISPLQYQNVAAANWSRTQFELPAEAPNFIDHLGQEDLRHAAHEKGKVLTTLDISLQTKVQQILDNRLNDLRSSEVTHGAVLVVDHESDEVLAWVNGRGDVLNGGRDWIDAVSSARQPGSTLKPFLYALALEMGWNAATLIEDAPLAQAVRSGLHDFHNYSLSHYGRLRLREALGNSLNVPAVHTIQFTGTDRFLQRLHALGFRSLTRPADFYGDGLALGNGEVTLYELVQGYAALARQGEFRPLRVALEAWEPAGSHRVFTRTEASLIADILADPQARQLEFGAGNLLRFPIQTAVKTGTSNDHRDAWALGFSRHHTVGVWMGNLDRRPTRGITGSSGPALVLRAVFWELSRRKEPLPLQLSPDLVSATICRASGLAAGPECPKMEEWFKATETPQRICPLHGGSNPDMQAPVLTAASEGDGPRLLQPTEGLLLAMDPRIPDKLEAFPFLISKGFQASTVEWLVDGAIAGITSGGQHQYLWPLSRGKHVAQARVWPAGAPQPVATQAVSFSVK